MPVDHSLLDGMGIETIDVGHRPGGHLQCREQAGGAVAAVVVGVALDLPRSQRQHGLGVIEGLDLGLLVGRTARSPLGGAKYSSTMAVTLATRPPTFKYSSDLPGLRHRQHAPGADGAPSSGGQASWLGSLGVTETLRYSAKVSAITCGVAVSSWTSTR